MQLSREVRTLLDERGAEEIKIFLSGDLDEHRIQSILKDGAKADAFGVGTKLVTSWDHPALGGIYKLVEFDGRPVMKQGGEKATWPGGKQVYRTTDAHGFFTHDTVTCAGEPAPGGEPLLKKVMEGGERLQLSRPVHEARKRWLRLGPKLPETVRSFKEPSPYEVRWSQEIRDTRQRLEEKATQ